MANSQIKCPKCDTVSQVPFQSVAADVVAEQVAAVEDPQATDASLADSAASLAPETPLAPAASISELAKQRITGKADDRKVGEQTPTRELYQNILKEVEKVFVGQDDLVLGTLVALFAGGHVLIESVPGLGKTLFVRTLGKILGCDFGTNSIHG